MSVSAGLLAAAAGQADDVWAERIAAAPGVVAAGYRANQFPYAGNL